ncbi:MAG TPA: sugar ABC transporter substrate-binding protein [Acidimicrobiia bacterium]|nr:sugar ABC transporter substrate-binding protein [Acidimicrobiia bacterium]
MTETREFRLGVARRRRSVCAVVAVAASALALAGLGVDARSAAGADASRDEITIAVVTHGDGGSFWSVEKRGALDAGRDLGIRVRYSASNNDPERQARLIDRAVRAHVDGLAVSAPNPDAIAPAVERAVDAGIPVVTLNSGADHFKQLGAFTHVGQTEFEAGQGAGTQLTAAGATKVLCVIHEQSNVALEQRCNGAATAFAAGVERFEVAGSGDMTATRRELESTLRDDPTIDAVLALDPDIAIAARDAASQAGSHARIATFDLSAQVIAAIEAGQILFAVDQQPYLQGYLPVAFLYLFERNGNTTGGGLPVLTGPAFVTAANAHEVEELARAGTR